MNPDSNDKTTALKIFYGSSYPLLPVFILVLIMFRASADAEPSFFLSNGDRALLLWR